MNSKALVTPASLRLFFASRNRETKSVDSFFKRSATIVTIGSVFPLADVSGGI